MSRGWKKEIYVFIVVLVFAAPLITACGTTEGVNAQPVNSRESTGPSYTLRLAESQTEDYPVTLGNRKFAEMVHEQTNGRIKIDVYPSGQLGDERSTIEQLQLGVLDFSRVSSSPLAEFNRDFGVFSLPYVFESGEHMWAFLDGETGTELLTSLHTSSLVGLTYYDAGGRSFFTKEPVETVEDLKELKIRIPQNKINIDLMTAFGAEAVPLPYGDVYQALQEGVIDGAENNLPSYYFTRAYEVAPNYISNVHQTPPDVLLMSKTTWDKLTEEERMILKEAAHLSSLYQREIWKESEKKAIKKLEEHGVTIMEVTDSSSWKEAAKPVMEKYQLHFLEVLEGVERAK
ncbi:TRAP transporter substrate-binding protein [Alkalihalobacillus sp. MEB130]|uniref:TRAP transporter substrate-binding protein n=1 Tax=Alkalihalobacillus sp. MEB130 TaxID=2976704 RepID=UPI0028DF991E|nr:TRAP transporter substrate-binding protein [Alkalihalobacillus sp. MEB130]MDT8858933.1 TRAP transporter substrate-binding protein [Alkalihalobacillus sp. MEB130]